MPADRCARLIFGHQQVLEPGLVEPGEPGSLLPHGKQEIGDVRRSAELRLVEVISPAERHHAPLAGETVKLELLKRKALDLGDERGLFRFLEEVRLIWKAFRRPG